MRVSSPLGESFIYQTNQLENEQNTLQSEATTGLKFAMPGDNPAGMSQALELEADSSANTQYQNNITQLQDSATTSYKRVKRPANPHFPGKHHCGGGGRDYFNAATFPETPLKSAASSSKPCNLRTPRTAAAIIFLENSRQHSAVRGTTDATGT